MNFLHLFVERHNSRLDHAIECGLHSVTGGEVANEVGEVLFGGAHLLVDGSCRGRHVLRVNDLLTALTVEAAIHHLAMIVKLDWPVPLRTPTSSAGS